MRLPVSETRRDTMTREMLSLLAVLGSATLGTSRRWWLSIMTACWEILSISKDNSISSIQLVKPMGR